MLLRLRRQALSAPLGLLMPVAAGAHADGPDTGRIADLPWSFEPWVLVALAVSAGLYAVGMLRLWRQAGTGRGVHAGQAAAFASGWLVLVLALVTPLDPLGARLF